MSSIPRSLEHCWQQLPAVSKTFAMVIPVLPEPVATPVLAAYFLSRLVDTFELGSLADHERKEKLVSKLLWLCETKKRSKEAVHQFITAWCEGRGVSSEADICLLQSLEDILNVLDSLPDGPRQSVLRCVGLMGRGVASIERQSGGYEKGSRLVLERTKELEEYCYYVAGTVGEMLTSLFAWHSARVKSRLERLRRRSVAFAEGVHLASLLKDIHEDLVRGFCWIPRELQIRHGLDPDKLMDPEHKDAVSSLVRELTGLARTRLEDALDCALVIPWTHRRMRLFCLWPLFMAVLTLRQLPAGGAHVHSPSQIKLSRAMLISVLFLTKTIFWSDSLLRLCFRFLVRKLPPSVSMSADKGFALKPKAVF